MKFLGFEQVLKNSLTSLPMGGGKGGADFDPKGKSNNEIMRFCQSYMTELYRHIGPNTDVPAGDIGVSAIEVGYFFGQYKRIMNEWSGVLTGKGQDYGGSLIRPEATGYGVVWFAREAIAHYKKKLEGQRCLVSGSGNVAQFCSELLIELGAKVITLSDSNGYILEPEGLTKEQLERIVKIKSNRASRISEYTKYSTTAKYFDGKRPWEQPGDIAFPCATQNEIELVDAENLVKGKVWALIEGANMPTTNDAITYIQKHKMIFAPAKAANAGGVACSGLEMSQNSIRIKWDRAEVKEKLETIMKNIYKACYNASVEFGEPGNLQLGANAAGFDKVAKAMIAQGCV
jgi:glutamate dehydrogenase (NADP+)